jgi:hypothetical protein
MGVGEEVVDNEELASEVDAAFGTNTGAFTA